MNISTLWQFSRPHTIVGTTVSICSLQILALGERLVWGELFWTYFWTFFWTWIACLGANVAIVGVNQVMDIEIDRINKPQLPLPAQTMTREQAWLVITTGAVLSLGISALDDIYLLGTVALSLLIGFTYSVPPLRWKRYALWASIAIISVRGSIVNVGLFWHFTGAVQLPALIWLITGFMLGFGLVIALAKDAPDTTGDRAFGIETVALDWGGTKVLRRSAWLLMGLYGVGALVAYGLGLHALSIGLGVSGVVVAWQTYRITKVENLCPSEMQNFYQFIWRMFYGTYLIFPLGLL